MFNEGVEVTVVVCSPRWWMQEEESGCLDFHQNGNNQSNFDKNYYKDNFSNCKKLAKVSLTTKEMMCK